MGCMQGPSRLIVKCLKHRHERLMHYYTDEDYKMLYGPVSRALLRALEKPYWTFRGA